MTYTIIVGIRLVENTCALLQTITKYRRIMSSNIVKRVVNVCFLQKPNASVLEHLVPPSKLVLSVCGLREYPEGRCYYEIRIVSVHKTRELTANR